jgi:hypothetical protein
MDSVAQTPEKRQKCSTSAADIANIAKIKVTGTGS